MSISKPFHRTYRPFSNNRDAYYIFDREYAVDPGMYTRSFIMLQKELLELFDYVEPADTNLKTYSLKIYSLFVRVCIEVEANFRAILSENHFTLESPRNWTKRQYRIINKSHHLSSYKVTFPIWSGKKSEFVPFNQWKNTSGDLEWYAVYNECKHNRYGSMPKANFEALLNAFSALFIILSAQFGTEAYAPGSCMFAVSNPEGYYPDKFGIGDYLLIDFPDDWTDDELYDFDWRALSESPSRFQKYNYDEHKRF